MLKKFLFALILLLIGTAAFAVGDQAYLGMFAETSSTKMAGMAMPEMPELPPGMEAMFGGGGPKRTFNIRLWSPSIAPKDAFAYIVPPAGLKQGKKLELELYRPTAEESKGEAGGTGSQGGMTDFTIKYYWGSSPTVKPGQPKVFSMNSLTPEQKRTMKETANEATGSYFYKPNWTTGYWPTKKQPGNIAKDANLEGNYALTTNYTGNVTIDCPANVNFLAPIDMTSPKLDNQVNLEAAIAFKWKPIPHLLGSHAMIMGMEGEKTLIIWSSSEVWNEAMMGVNWGYLQMAEVRQFVKDTIMMEGGRTDVTVPAGIFKNADMANFMMTGYGPGAARDDTQPLPRIQTKTTLNIMLGGKEMADMGDMGGGDFGDFEESEDN